MIKRIWQGKAIAMVAVCVAAAVAANAQTFKTMVVFNSANGGQPAYMSMIEGTDGNLYGTTDGGGSSELGTAFKLTLKGRLTTLNSLVATDGSAPLGGLVQATNGNFYGVTSADGANGWGTIFKMTAKGVVTDLHDFNNTGDGGEAFAALIQGNDGNLYGTNLLGPNGQGTVYKWNPSKSEFFTMHVFTGGADGGEPFGGLAQGAPGVFYGTTSAGGNGNGTIFKVTSHNVLTTLHTFKASGTDGASPYAGLVKGTDGDYYGTTFGGGTHGKGTVFKITTAGMLTTLHSFTGMGVDGASPAAGLIQATDGNFYGTTTGGGLHGDGTIFQMTPAGMVMTMHSFDGTHGGNPLGGVTQASDGNLYGTTNSGGINTVGTIYQLSLGLPPR